jgi:hypothetical protein
MSSELRRRRLKTCGKSSTPWRSKIEGQERLTEERASLSEEVMAWSPLLELLSDILKMGCGCCRSVVEVVDRWRRNEERGRQACLNTFSLVASSSFGRLNESG